MSSTLKREKEKPQPKIFFLALWIYSPSPFLSKDKESINKIIHVFTLILIHQRIQSPRPEIRLARISDTHSYLKPYPQYTSETRDTYEAKFSIFSIIFLQDSRPT